MEKIKSEIELGLSYECPVCGNEEIEPGQNYCQICGELLDWQDQLSTIGT